MDRNIIVFVMLSFCTLLTTRTHAQLEAGSGAKKRAGALTIALISFELSDKAIKLCYEIRNDSEQDAWILVGTGESGVEADLFMDEDGRTLMIRNRLDFPTRAFFNMFYGRYVRLLAGKTKNESVSLTIPVHPHHGLEGGRQARGLEYAKRLAIEIGYYAGDMPAMILDILEKADKVRDETDDKADDLRHIKTCFGGLLQFNMRQEYLRQRDEEILIPYTWQALKGEQVLRATFDGLRIPYEEKVDLSKERYPPDLIPCTRIEIQYQPSMLEYFFPYAGQQSLLSPEETEYLQSEKTIFVDDPKDIKSFVYDVSKGVSSTGVVRERSKAHVVCYHDGKRLKSFPIYNNESIVIEGERFMYFKGFPSLKMLPPQIQPIELRILCADNLRDLGSWLGLYYKIEKFENAYPPPTEWCDAIMRAYQSVGRLRKDAEPLKCPSVPEGKCHYALNPNCKPNSQPDTVLLFETKAGWNQYGGPDLFTFDNHEPMGGCVLLNDGTVKFIRTKKELQQLRWK